MKEYPKIQTIFKRDEKTHGIILGDYSLPEFEYLKNNIWIFTEKVDGTNIRIIWDGDNVTIGGKTENAQIPTFLFSKLQELFGGDINRQKFREVFQKDGESFTDVCLCGEGFGAKIQKGGGNYMPNGVDFVLFDIKIGEWWLSRENMKDIADKLGIKIIPQIGEGTLADMIDCCKYGTISEWGNFTAEGIVAKPKIELRDRKGNRIITKLKHKDFKCRVAQ